MKILVINAGSSSLKYQLIDLEGGTVIAKGLCERIGIGGSLLKFKASNGQAYEVQKDMKDHTDAIRMVVDALIDPDRGVIASMDEIGAVGHRVVHGGERFSGSVRIDDEVIKTLEEMIVLAPLHNPANLKGIRACQAIMPNVPMVGVFDTAFHQTMPREAFLYALPYEAYQDLMIRRYGFHGTSHYYVSSRAIELLGFPKEQTRVITCHLGNGSSIAAVKGGVSLDTSMGFTPLAGVPMGTRCGDIDPAIVPYLMERKGFSCDQVCAYMNKDSGVYGISGVSSDFRDLKKAAKEGNERAAIAVESFAYSVKKYIGAYAAVMNGVDAIVFTAGVGENDSSVREKILSGLDYLGIEADFEKNRTAPSGVEVDITKPTSRVKVYVIPTDEEMVIARDTARLAVK